MPRSAFARRLTRLLPLFACLLLGWSYAAGAPASVSPNISPAAAPDLPLVGRLAFPDGHPATELAVAGRYAYVASNDARFEGWGLRVVDVLNPQSPALVGVYNIPHQPGETGQVPGLALSGNDVLLAAGEDGLEVVDASSPTTPTPIGSFYPSATPYVWDVAVAGDYAYVAAGDDGLRILDISDPTAPTEVGDLPNCCAVLVTVAGSYAYLSTGDTLLIVDVSDPTAPAEVGSLSLTDQTPRTISGISVADDVAYVTFGYCMRACIGGLVTIDVSDPANPVQLGSEGEALGRPFTTVQVAGDYAFVGVDNGCSAINNLCSGRLRVIDVSDPSTPYAVTEAQLGTGPTGIAVVGDLVYAIDDSPAADTTGGRLSIFRYIAPLPNRAYMPVITR